MEECKLYEKYIKILSNAIDEDMKAVIIDEICRNILENEEIEELKLSFYLSNENFNYYEDSRKLRARLEMKRAKLIDKENDNNRKLDYIKTEFKLAKIKEVQKSNVIINNKNHIEDVGNYSGLITFESAKEKINNIENISKEDKEEIIKNIEKIEIIIKSDESKQRKWEHTKDIIRWIADKSVDVGILLLKLILKID